MPRKGMGQKITRGCGMLGIHPSGTDPTKAKTKTYWRQAYDGAEPIPTCAVCDEWMNNHSLSYLRCTKDGTPIAP